MKPSTRSQRKTIKNTRRLPQHPLPRLGRANIDHRRRPTSDTIAMDAAPSYFPPLRKPKPTERPSSTHDDQDLRLAIESHMLIRAGKRHQKPRSARAFITAATRPFDMRHKRLRWCRYRCPVSHSPRVSGGADAAGSDSPRWRSRHRRRRDRATTVLQPD